MYRPRQEDPARLDELADGSDHFELYVFPHTTTALTRSGERKDQEPVIREQVFFSHAEALEAAGLSE